MKTHADVLLDLARELQRNARIDRSQAVGAYRLMMRPPVVNTRRQVAACQRMAERSYAQARAVYEAAREARLIQATMVEMETFFAEQELPPYRDPWDYGACEEKP